MIREVVKLNGLDAGGRDGGEWLGSSKWNWNWMRESSLICCWR